MNRLSCNVKNCNNNSFGMCHMDKVNIDGKKACHKIETQCCSFEKGGIFKRKNTYSLNQYLNKLTEVLDDEKTPDISCNVYNCMHNKENKCTCNNVMIYGIKAKNRENTNCTSFHI